MEDNITTAIIVNNAIATLKKKNGPSLLELLELFGASEQFADDVLTQYAVSADNPRGSAKLGKTTPSPSSYLNLGRFRLPLTEIAKTLRLLNEEHKWGFDRSHIAIWESAAPSAEPHMLVLPIVLTDGDLQSSRRRASLARLTHAKVFERVFPDFKADGMASIVYNPKSLGRPKRSLGWAVVEARELGDLFEQFGDYTVPTPASLQTEFGEVGAGIEFLTLPWAAKADMPYDDMGTRDFITFGLAPGDGRILSYGNTGQRGRPNAATRPGIVDRKLVPGIHKRKRVLFRVGDPLFVEYP